jgi:hypothetical protein
MVFKKFLYTITMCRTPDNNPELTTGGDPLRGPRDNLYPQKLALTSTTSGGRSVGIFRLRTKGHGV